MVRARREHDRLSYALQDEMSKCDPPEYAAMVARAREHTAALLEQQRRAAKIVRDSHMFREARARALGQVARDERDFEVPAPRLMLQP